MKISLSNDVKSSEKIPLLRCSDNAKDKTGIIKIATTLNTKKESITDPQSEFIEDKDNPKSEYCLHAIVDQSKRRKLKKNSMIVNRRRITHSESISKTVE